MKENYSDSIQYSITNSRVYKEDFKVDVISHQYDTKIEVIQQNSQVAVKEATRHDGKVCVLNFASYKNPGGGFLRGAMAQEEALCSVSTLYNILESDKLMEGYYLPNRDEKNYGLYKDRSIYTDKVLFESSYYADVLTCPAPNAGTFNRYHAMHLEEGLLKKTQLSRIDHLLSVAYANNVEVLILGAFGCGVFHNNAVDMANYFKQMLSNKYKGVFKEVIFAVPDDKNFKAFEGVFK
jgi:uncharacterized protein (TIGR02452 family)